MRAWRLCALRRGRWGTITLALILGLCLSFVVACGLSGRSFLANRLVLKRDHLGYKYFVLGNRADVVTRTRPGFVLEGGGTDIDESFQWMIERSGGGDFVVIRTTGTDAYNDYVYDLSTPGGLGVDSAATLIVTSREGSFDPFVAQTIRSAEALWIAGGDQALHYARWRGTPVADAIHDLVARGVPVGGTSSGLAVMGEHIYTAEGDGPQEPHLTSTQALRDPRHSRLKTRSDFLQLPFLDGVILEPHFIQESRYGRMAVFLTQIAASRPEREARGIGIDRKTALLVEADGSGRVITRPDHPHGKVILFRFVTPAEPRNPGQSCQPFANEAEEFRSGGEIDLLRWKGRGGSRLQFRIEANRIVLTRP